MLWPRSPTHAARSPREAASFACAAIDRLVSTGALAFDTPAFAYLGTSKLFASQTPDPRIGTITVKHLATRRSGLERNYGKGVDFRVIAQRLGLGIMPWRTLLVRYIYGEPLLFAPGTDESYSNSAFDVLASIVERASRRPFIDYLRDEVLSPLQINDVQVGATAANMRRPNEVSTYEDPGVSPSQIDMAAGVNAPNAYGGTFALENGEGAGGLIMSTGTVARFLATNAVWDIGPREVGTRYGLLAGTGAVAVSRPDGLDFAYAFNRSTSDHELDAFTKLINAVLDRHSSNLAVAPIYAVMPDGRLLWNVHYGSSNGTFKWASSHGEPVGSGWDAVQQAFSGGDGIIYYVLKNGDLMWNRHEGWNHGTNRWATPTGVKVGNGWQGAAHVFAGHDGVIYAVYNSGRVMWNRHEGRKDGTNRWLLQENRNVANAVNKLVFWRAAHVFAGGDPGIIYAIMDDGELLWFDHNGWWEGTASLTPDAGQTVGFGWQVKGAFGLRNTSCVYAVMPDGQLRWNILNRSNNGTFSWASNNGEPVGSGWVVKHAFSG